MQPALIILISWLLFAGSHLIASSSAIRPSLVRKFGERGFTLIYVCITIITMAPLTYLTATYAGQGASGPNLAAYAAGRWILGLVSGSGLILMVAGLIDFRNSSIFELSMRKRMAAAAQNKPLPPPSTIERVSRHPFFVGLSIFAVGHLLMAATLAQAIYFGGFASLSLAGFYFQDRKLRQQWKQVYSEFESNTAALSVGQSGKTDEPGKSSLKLWAMAAAIVTLLFGAAHQFWSYANGAPLAGAILFFGLLATLSALSKKG